MDDNIIAVKILQRIFIKAQMLGKRNHMPKICLSAENKLDAHFGG